MANKKYGIKHCNATVADYDEIKNTCPCMKCFGTGCDMCIVWNNKEKMLVCHACKFHQGR